MHTRSHITTEILISPLKIEASHTLCTLKHGSPLTWERQAVTPKKVWHDSGEKPLTLDSSCQGCK